MSEEASYRDKIATVDEKGKRVWVFPKKPFGKFYSRRKLLSYVLLTFLFAGPFIRIGGQPLLMLNILERKFVIFGQIFWPQDLHLFAIATLTLILFVVVFTIVFGRLFCGWVCPQTIFMEMIFRRIEYLIEGDWKQQQRLRASKWTIEKILKKTSKHLIFWGISFLIANTFLAYIVGSDHLLEIIQDNPSEHVTGLIAIIIFTTVFYFVFAKFREQVCTVVCPYGRLQDVLLDQKSLVVAYDHVRGEGRGLLKKNEDRAASGKGDCIDCKQCVNVCPTGIDIRNGTQLECINCTACIDVCNHMMDGVGMERGLIRYDSVEGIEKKSPFKITKRVAAYMVVLGILLTLLTVLLASRSDFEATILRTRGTLFQQVEGSYSNIYDVSLVNKTNIDMPIEIRLIDAIGEIRMIGDAMHLKAMEEATGKFMILLSEDELKGRKMKLKIGVYSNGELIEKVNTSFIGPVL